jgi:hypothetical protein
MPTGAYIVAGIAVLLVLVAIWAGREVRKQREEAGEGMRSLGLTYHPRDSVNPRKAHRILMAEGTWRGLSVTVEDDFPRRPGGDGTVISTETRIQADGLQGVPRGRLSSRKRDTDPVTDMRTERIGVPELDERFELKVERAEDAELWRRIASLPSLAPLLEPKGSHLLVYLEVVSGQATVQLDHVTAPAERVRVALDTLADLSQMRS